MMFAAAIDPDTALLERIETLSPTSPFDTVGYAQSLHALGGIPCAFTIVENGQLVSGSIASLSGSRWSRQLEIFSAPTIHESDAFWWKIADFCKQHSVADLSIQTFASTSPSSPPFAPGNRFNSRIEYKLHISPGESLSGISQNHQRNIMKAERTGVVMHTANTESAYAAHIELMTASASRRQKRGERIATPQLRSFELELLTNGIGEMYQAFLGREIVSSLFLLTSTGCGYLYSSGTSKNGMQIGASHYLVRNTATALAERGINLFNLGGTDIDATGLRRFKKGFGAEENQLFSAAYSMSSPTRRALVALARKIKSLAHTDKI